MELQGPVGIFYIFIARVYFDAPSFPENFCNMR
jgi:hypothetical protein